MNQPTQVITHTAVSRKDHTAQDVDEWHKLRWPGFTSKIFKNKKGEYYHVGYHYVIEWDGSLVQCRGEQEEGAHCVGCNNSSLGVCFMGNGDIHLPSPEQVKTFVALFKVIQSRHPTITVWRLFPHRKYANKTCHGSLVPTLYWPLEVLKARLKELINLKKR